MFEQLLRRPYLTTGRTLLLWSVISCTQSGGLLLLRILLFPAWGFQQAKLIHTTFKHNATTQREHRPKTYVARIVVTLLTAANYVACKMQCSFTTNIGRKRQNTHISSSALSVSVIQNQKLPKAGCVFAVVAFLGARVTCSIL